MSFKKLRVLFIILLLSLNIQIEAEDEFVYSLRLGESLDSVRGKLDIGFTTKNADGFSFVSLQLIPGAPRYTTNTTLIFFQEKFTGAVFSIDPRITDFFSYEEKNKFLLNTYSTLVKKFDKKYGLDNGDKSVDCGLRASNDFSECSAVSNFSNKYKFVRLRFDDEKIILYLLHRKKFDSFNEFTNKALISLYSEHINGMLKFNKDNLRPGVTRVEKSINYETSTLEVEYSDIP